MDIFVVTTLEITFIIIAHFFDHLNTICMGN